MEGVRRPGTLMVSEGGVGYEDSLKDVAESDSSGVKAAGDGERDFMGVWKTGAFRPSWWSLWLTGEPARSGIEYIPPATIPMSRDDL